MMTQVEKPIAGRVTVPEMEALIGKHLPVLDKGFIRLIDYMGSDSSIVQAARISYGGGTKTPQEDAGLIDFLIRHRHTSPLEMCELKLHIKMPIFVARQWIRHRTASLNEYSARYCALPSDFYAPNASMLRGQDTKNKQKGSGVLAQEVAEEVEDQLKHSYTSAFECYESLMEKGLAREIARCVLPLSVYTEMYWKCDLHNLMHLLQLRIAHGAQSEIAAYAEVILDQIVKVWVPMSYESFLNHKVNGATFSQKQKEAIFSMLSPAQLKQFVEENIKGRGEMRELAEMLKSSSYSAKEELGDSLTK